MVLSINDLRGSACLFNLCSPQFSPRIAYSSYLNSLMLDFTPTKTKKTILDGWMKNLFSLLLSAQYYQIVWGILRENSWQIDRAWYCDMKMLLQKLISYLMIPFLRQSVQKWILQTLPILNRVFVCIRCYYCYKIFLFWKCYL